METRAHHVLIGLFTLAGLLAALFFGIWLVQSGQQQETRRYRVVFNEAVTGLTVGSLVQYNGLRVGEVRQLQLDPEDPRRVLADMEVNAATPINQGTRARLAIANITGAANILLSTDNPAAIPLEKGEAGLPVLYAEPSAIGALLGNGEALLSGVSELVEQSAELLSQDNIDRIGRIIHNLEQVSEELAKSRTGVGETLETLTATAQGAQTVLQAATGLINNVDRLLVQDGAPMVEDGRRAMQSLAQSGEQLERLLTRNAGALDNGLQGMAEIGPVMQELQRSLGTLNRILSRLEEDPAAYFTGRPPAPEFTP
jgi:phospholipid/cholesterol/gamma-HCH transport system substrate-binding protein